jgi:drug/metabolite transporter (DMT)-like permease
MNKDIVLSYFSKHFITWESKNQGRAAIIYMILSNLAFSIMNLFVKFSKSVPIFQIIYSRGFLNILFCFMMIPNKEKIIDSDQRTYKLLFWRGALGSFSLIALFHSLSLLPLSIAVVINMMTPLWVGILGALLYGEVFRTHQIIINLVSFVGVIFILKPDFLFKTSEKKIENTVENYLLYQSYILGVFFAVLNSFLNAVVMLTIRELKNRTNIIVVIFYLNFFNIIYAGVCAFYHPFVSIDWPDIINLLVISISGYLAQIFRSRALFLEKAFILSIISYIQLIFGYFCDIFLLSSPLDYFGNIGCVLIVISTLILIYIESYK